MVRGYVSGWSREDKSLTFRNYTAEPPRKQGSTRSDITCSCLTPRRGLLYYRQSNKTRRRTGRVHVERGSESRDRCEPTPARTWNGPGSCRSKSAGFTSESERPPG